MTDRKRSELERMPIGEVERLAAAGDANARAVLEELGAHCAALAKGALEAMNALHTGMSARLQANFEKAAVENFVTTALGLGPVLHAAFPKIGAICLAAAVHKPEERDAQVADRMCRTFRRPRCRRFVSHAPFTRRPPQ